jgi:polyferredoxin
MEDVGIGILRPFCKFCCQFGIFYGYSVYFSSFGMLYQEKSGNPVRHHQRFLGFPGIGRRRVRCILNWL